MHHRYFTVFIACVLLFSCKKEKGPDYSTVNPPDPPVQPILLKDIEIPHLPSPYYHFEYDAAGRPSFASFASDFFRYDITYEGERIAEMKNNILVNKDRLEYSYDNAGRVNLISYADSTGEVYTNVHFTYDGAKLTRLERERRGSTGFGIDKTMDFSYYADGNLMERTEHYPALNGQPESTFVDRFEQYDDKINVDGFGLLHDEFFDHFVFLPGVRLQKNNPGKETRTGDGINFTVNYSYTYHNSLPLTKTGDFTFTNGPDAGHQFQTSSLFSYY
jgi:hypothetical protein